MPVEYRKILCIVPYQLLFLRTKGRLFLGVISMLYRDYRGATKIMSIVASSDLTFFCPKFRMKSAKSMNFHIIIFD